jgi:DNA-binding CsgD family transcriptional regulator
MPYLPKEELLHVLTPREQEVVECIATGLEIKEIAHELQIGYHTTKMHIAHAKRKLGARNQLEIAILLHGGRPQAMPAAHEHPLRLCAEGAAAPPWRGSLRYSARQS